MYMCLANRRWCFYVTSSLIGRAQEMMFLCNVLSHWPGAYTKWSLALGWHCLRVFHMHMRFNKLSYVILFVKVNSQNVNHALATALILTAGELFLKQCSFSGGRFDQFSYDSQYHSCAELDDARSLGAESIWRCYLIRKGIQLQR